MLFYINECRQCWTGSEMTTVQKMDKKNYFQGDGGEGREIMVHTVNNQKEKRKIIAKGLFRAWQRRVPTGKILNSSKPTFILGKHKLYIRNHILFLFSPHSTLPLADHYFVPNLLLFFVLFWNCPDFSLRVRLGVFIFKKLF